MLNYLKLVEGIKIKRWHGNAVVDIMKASPNTILEYKAWVANFNNKEIPHKFCFVSPETLSYEHRPSEYLYTVF